MAYNNFKVQGFTHGTQNMLPDEIIDTDASSGSLDWITIDGKIELIRGRTIVGQDGLSGGIYGGIIAPRKDGTTVHFRKTDTAIQYLNGSTWTDVITGLTAEANYTFATYISLAGAYVYIGGVDGLYKIATANPASYKDMYNTTKNYKGFILINDQRMFLWNRSNDKPDKTGLYLSKIDSQRTNYTTVTNETLATGDGVTTTFTGTLAQATGTRFVFGLTLNTNPASVTATDDYVGIISGTGVTGTINYATGAYSLTFTTAPAVGTTIRTSYLYEDSNSNGLTDFTFSTTRVAGEGDIIPQEYLGEPIQNVLVFEGKYYSIKETCAYELDLTNDDTNATNIVYRKDVGIPSLRGAVGTSKGIVYMNTSNPDKPVLSLLQRNPVGDNLEPVNLTPTFKWEDYDYTDCCIDTYGESIVVMCKTIGATANNKMMLINTAQTYSVDVTSYGGNIITKNEGIMYVGDSVSNTTYEVFSGFDDVGYTLIDNYWESKGETYKDDGLKRHRYLQFAGLISKDQYVEVYESFDNQAYQLMGTIRGDQSYVDNNSSFAIGTYGLGTQSIGGGNTAIIAYQFIMQMKTRVPKFRKRKIKFIAKGLGYVAINWINDFDIMKYEDKIPLHYRQKQHISLNGEDTDLDNSPT